MRIACARRNRSVGVVHSPLAACSGIDVVDGRVTGVRTDRGDIATDVVVDAGGIYAHEIGRMAGVDVPVVAMAHQYAITRPRTTIPATLQASLRHRLQTSPLMDGASFAREVEASFRSIWNRWGAEAAP